MGKYVLVGECFAVAQEGAKCKARQDLVLQEGV